TWTNITALTLLCSHPKVAGSINASLTKTRSTNKSSPQSTNTGVNPTSVTARGQAIIVKSGTMTSLAGGSCKASRARQSEALPEEQATMLDGSSPLNSAHSFSSC